MPAMASEHQTWRDKAKCKDLPLEEVDRLFFVGRGGKTTRGKSFCADCKVKVQCLNFAIYYGEEGIWGGLHDNDRQAIPQVIGILSIATVRSYGVNTSETRDYTQWGMTEAQIQKERKKYLKLLPEPYPASEPQVQDQQPLMLVVEL